MSTKRTIWIVGMLALLVALFGIWKNREAMGLAGAVEGSSKTSRQAGVSLPETIPPPPVKTKLERSRELIPPSPEEEEAAKARTRKAINNARQLWLHLFEFESKYGSFPSEETAAAVKQATGTTAPVGAATANDCLHQLMAAKIVMTPDIFTWDEPGQDKGAVGLEKCGFSYLSGMSAAGDTSRPLLVAPLVPGTQVFDRKVFGGRAVILLHDGSVLSCQIEADETAKINGMDVFDPAQPFWGGTVPQIKWPEK